MSTRHYCEQWIFHKALEGEFAGVQLDDFPELEEFFDVNIHVFSLEADGDAHALYSSTRHFKENLYLNSYDAHLSLITDIAQYNHKFVCDKCSNLFKRLDNFKTHSAICKGEDGTKLVYPGGFYKQFKSLFDTLEGWGFKIEEKPEDFFITYDFECYLKKIPQPVPPTNTQWLAEHVPVSVAIASNVPGFTDPYCIVEPDLDVLLTEMLERMEEIKEAAAFCNGVLM